MKLWFVFRVYGVTGLQAYIRKVTVCPLLPGDLAGVLGTAEMSSHVIGHTCLTGDGWSSWEEGVYMMARE